MILGDARKTATIDQVVSGEGRKRETQFGGVRGNPIGGRPPGIVIGKQRKRELQKAAAMQEAISEVLPAKAVTVTDSLAYLRSLYCDERLPHELRLAAARAALPFEHVTRSAVAIVAPQRSPADARKRLEELLGKSNAPALLEG